MQAREIVCQSGTEYSVKCVPNEKGPHNVRAFLNSLVAHP